MHFQVFLSAVNNLDLNSELYDLLLALIIFLNVILDFQRFCEKFAAIILVNRSFLRFFALSVSSDAFNFSSSKTG